MYPQTMANLKLLVLMYDFINHPLTEDSLPIIAPLSLLVSYSFFNVFASINFYQSIENSRGNSNISPHMCKGEYKNVQSNSLHVGWRRKLLTRTSARLTQSTRG